MFDLNFFCSLTLAMGWRDQVKGGGTNNEVPNGGIYGMIFELGASFLFMFLFLKIFFL